MRVKRDPEALAQQLRGSFSGRARYDLSCEVEQAVDLTGMKILLVDDEEAVRDVVEMMLSMLGLEVDSAADGREAVAKFARQPERYQVILLDLSMPEMDGELCFQELRRIRNDIRVILSSGYNELELNDRFAGRGFSGFIQKPYTIDLLRETLEKTLETSPSGSSQARCS